MANQAVSLDIVLEDQKKGNWCWAAVSTSCAQAYNPATQWTQCMIAKACLQLDCCSQGPIHNPIAGGLPLTCNKIWPLQNDSNVGALVTANIANGFTRSPIAFDALRIQIDAGLVVAYLIEHLTYGRHFRHFVLVTGYRLINDKKFVRVQDSMFQDTDMIEYSKFVTSLYDQFKVIASYFTRGDNPIPKKVMTSDVHTHFNMELTKEKSTAVKKSKSKSVTSNFEYKIYRDSWENILRDRNLENATLVGERYFQNDENNETVALHKSADAAGFEKSIKFGPKVEEHMALSEKFSYLLENKNLENCLLKVETLRITAMWYRSVDRDQQANDLFIPLKPCFNGLEPGRVYTQAEFLPFLINDAVAFAESLNGDSEDNIL